MRRFEIESHLRAPADVVWARATTMDGVNDELGPWLQMTAPAQARGLDLRDAPIGRPLFRSWLLVGGVLPVDFDDLAFARVDRAGAFEERSTMLSMRRWEHDRRVRAMDGGCLVRDELRFEPRVPGTGPLVARIVAAVFRHRHARLRRRYGTLLRAG